MRKGYLLVFTLIFLASVAMVTTVVMDYVGNTSKLIQNHEIIITASTDSLNGLQMGTSYLAHFSDSIGSFSLKFDGNGSVPFSSVEWLQTKDSNNFFDSLYSSVDEGGWKTALDALSKDSNVLWLNKIPKIENFFEKLKNDGLLSSVPDVAIIQLKAGNTDADSTYRYLVVSRAFFNGRDAYSSGFVLANSLNRYLYFTDREKSNIYFTSGEIMDGPVRSNDVINIQGNPVFEGEVEAKGYRVVSGKPKFLSGNTILSESDIQSMNMTKIASDYSSQINSLVYTIPTIKTTDTASSVGIDVSGVLKSEFETDMNDWLGKKDENIEKLPPYIRNYYGYACDELGEVLSRVKLVFDSNGNSKTLNAYYESSYGNVEDALYAVNQLEGSGYFGGFSGWEGKKSKYNGPDFTNVESALEDLETGNGWNPLFSIKPEKGSTIPGTVTFNPNGNASKFFGIPSNPFDFNFNGIIKTNSNLFISGRKNSSGNDDKTAYVSGKYTVYSTKNVYIESNIVYSDADELFGGRGKSANSWITSPVSTSMADALKNSTCTDFLNVVAGDNVVLTDSVPGNMKLMASVYAFNGSFSYEDYDDSYPMGQLFLYGSLMQHERGPVGTFGYGGPGWYGGNGYQTTAGFYKYYVYDWRILGGLASDMYGTPSSEEKAILLAVRTTY